MSLLPFWWKQAGEKSLIKPAQNKCQVSFGYSLQLYLFCVHVCTYIITCTAWSSLFAHSLRAEVQHNRGRCSWPQCLKNSKWKSPQAAGGGSKKRRLQITCVRERAASCVNRSQVKREQWIICVEEFAGMRTRWNERWGDTKLGLSVALVMDHEPGGAYKTQDRISQPFVMTMGANSNTLSCNQVPENYFSVKVIKHCKSRVRAKDHLSFLLT